MFEDAAFVCILRVDIFFVLYDASRRINVYVNIRKTFLLEYSWGIHEFQNSRYPEKKFGKLHTNTEAVKARLQCKLSFYNSRNTE